MLSVIALHHIVMRLLTLSAFLLAIITPPLRLDADESTVTSLIGSLIEQSAFSSLNEDDFRRIRRQGNTYLVPVDLKQRVLLNLPSLGNHATVRKVRSGEVSLGYRLESLSSRGIFPYLGLRVGDIIRSVNGNSINSEQEALSLIGKLNAATKVSLQIERGIKRVPTRLNYQIVD